MDGVTTTNSNAGGFGIIGIIFIILILFLVIYYLSTKKGKKSTNKKGPQPAVVVGAQGASPGVVV